MLIARLRVEKSTSKHTYTDLLHVVVSNSLRLMQRKLILFKSSPEESDYQSFLTAYFGPEVSQMRDAVDRRCQIVLEDLLSFFESEKAGPRLKNLAPYVQNKCYDNVSALLADVDKELEFLCATMKKENKNSKAIPPAIIIEKSLFMGHFLFALMNHSKHVPLILGSPRLWCRETMTAVRFEIICN